MKWVGVCCLTTRSGRSSEAELEPVWAERSPRRATHSCSESLPIVILIARTNTPLPRPIRPPVLLNPAQPSTADDAPPVNQPDPAVVGPLVPLQYAPELSHDLPSPSPALLHRPDVALRLKSSPAPPRLSAPTGLCSPRQQRERAPVLDVFGRRLARASASATSAAVRAPAGTARQPIRVLLGPPDAPEGKRAAVEPRRAVRRARVPPPERVL